MIVLALGLSFIALYILLIAMGVIFAIIISVFAWFDTFLWRRNMLGSTWAVICDWHMARKSQRKFKHMVARRYGNANKV